MGVNDCDCVGVIAQTAGTLSWVSERGKLRLLLRLKDTEKPEGAVAQRRHRPLRLSKKYQPGLCAPSSAAFFDSLMRPWLSTPMHFTEMMSPILTTSLTF